MTRTEARPNPFLLAALFGAALFVYVRTLCPTVYWEDAGELITASHVLGIAHPPGHPLYTIFGHLFTLIPLGTIAARVNFMSAFFGALASALLYPTVFRLLQEKAAKRFVPHCAGATASLFAAFGLTLWDQSVVAETSTLHAFFFMTLLLLFLSILRASDDSSFSRRLFLFSFAYGLSLTNHVAGVLLLPAFALWALMSPKMRFFSCRNTLLSLLLFFLGLSVYLYLPIRSAQDPVIDWGNPETLSNFWWVITAGQFRGNAVGMPPASEMLEVAASRISTVCENFMSVGILLILVGIWRAFRERRDFFLFASVATVTLFVVTLNPAFIIAYFIPALLLLAVFLGLGADALATAVADYLGNSSLRRTLTAAVCGALLFSSMLPLLRHYSMNDKSGYFWARNYGMRILEALPPNAAFFTIDLNAVFTIWYLMYCEGIRRDVLVVEPTWLTNSDPMREEILERYPELLMPKVGEKIVTGERLGETSFYDRDFLFAILRKNSEVRPVFLGAVPIVPSLRPRGLLYEFVPEGEDVLDDETIKWNKDSWEKIADEFRREPALACDRVASLIYPENLTQQGRLFVTQGRGEHARWAFELASKMNAAYAPAWLGLGELCERKGEYEDALRYLDHAAGLDSTVRPRALFIKAHIFYELGEYDRATKQLLRVIAERHDFPGAHNALGTLYLRMGEIAGAEDEFREEIRINPSTAAAYSNLAQILIQKAELGEAEKTLRNGIGVNARAWQNFYFLAMMKASQGRRGEAARLFDEAAGLGGRQVVEMAGRGSVLGETLALLPEPGSGD